MSMELAKGGGKRGRRQRSRSKSAISEINVTPLVDVMLVLLIVFMVSAPLLTVGVPIDLPTTAAKIMEPESKPIMITVSLDGDIFIGEESVGIEDVLSVIHDLAQKGTDERLYIRGDTAAQYGKIMKVMGRLSVAGYAHIGLITQQEQAE